MIERWNAGTQAWVRVDESYYGNPFIWTAQRYDAGVKLYSLYARTYSPELGRWLQRDPLGYVDGVNLYEYVASRPTVLVDPLGLMWIRRPDGDGAGGGGDGGFVGPPDPEGPEGDNPCGEPNGGVGEGPDGPMGPPAPPVPPPLPPGMTPEDLRNRYPDLYRQWERYQNDPPSPNWGAEWVAELIRRMIAEMNGQDWGSNDVPLSDDPVHAWVRENIWKWVHSQEGLAGMSDAQMYGEAIGASVVIGFGGYYGVTYGIAAAQGTAGTASMGYNGASFVIRGSQSGMWMIHSAGRVGPAYLAPSHYITLPVRFVQTLANPAGSGNCLSGMCSSFLGAF